MQFADSENELSPEADKYLGDATSEFNAKQAALDKNWGFDSYERWDYDQSRGVVCLTFADGSQFYADGQVLGSYCQGDGTFEWAWNNPNVENKLMRDSLLVRGLGERRGIGYLQVGRFSIPQDDFVSSLSARINLRQIRLASPSPW